VIRYETLVKHHSRAKLIVHAPHMAPTQADLPRDAGQRERIDLLSWSTSRQAENCRLRATLPHELDAGRTLVQAYQRPVLDPSR